MTYFTRYAVPSPCPSSRVRADEAEYTITAPPASRQNVAVSSSRCSSGCGLSARAELAIRAGFDAGGRAPPSHPRFFPHAPLARTSARKRPPRGAGACPDPSPRADERAEVAAALLERVVLVVGGAGRRQQDGVAAAAEDHVDVAGEGLDPDDGRGDVRRLRVVDVQHAVDGRDLLQPVRDAG